MKKYLSFTAIFCLLAFYLQAQNADYRVVFDMTSKDSINQQSLVRELGLIRKYNPDAKMEVVMYGAGLNLVVKDRTPQQQPAVEKLIMDKNISFKVCAIAMERQAITKDQLLAGIQVVPDGIYEIVSKQREGWGYIKVSH